MFCTKCGTQMADTANFCSACGKPAGEACGPSAPPRRLRRIRSEKKIAGVCAGFAEYFDIDVTLMRIIWVALALLPPSVGCIGYVIAWMVLPSESAVNAD